MYLRYFGIFAIFVSCSAVGFLLAGSEGGRIKNNEALIALIKHIRRKALYFKSTSADIFETFSSEALEKNGFCSVMRSEGLSAALDRVQCFELDESCERSVEHFANEMGVLPIGELVSSCDNLIEELYENQARLSKESPARQKAYSSLGMLFGIMIVILLV